MALKLLSTQNLVHQIHQGLRNTILYIQTRFLNSNELDYLRQFILEFFFSVNVHLGL